MKVNLSNGQSFEYETKVVKAQLFSSEEIFEKRLLLLLPYYLMRYEKALTGIEVSWIAAVWRASSAWLARLFALAHCRSCVMQNYAQLKIAI